MTDYDTEQVLTFFADNRAVRGKLESWMDELASKHVSVQEAMAIIQERMSDYLKEIYDAIYRKATGEQNFFLWYPHPNWVAVTRYFRDDYRERLTDKDRSARAGSFISRDYYDEMLEVIPPLDVPKALLDRYGCTHGFLMGEPWGTGPGGVNTYKAYGVRPDGKCMYLGLSPRAKDSEYPDYTRSWNGKATGRSASKTKRKPKGGRR